MKCEQVVFSDMLSEKLIGNLPAQNAISDNEQIQTAPGASRDQEESGEVPEGGEDGREDTDEDGAEDEEDVPVPEQGGQVAPVGSEARVEESGRGQCVDLRRKKTR